MAIFGLFLKSIFIVALLAAVFIIGVTVYLYLRVRRVAKTFANAGRHSTAGQRTAGQRQGTGTGGGNGAYSRDGGNGSQTVYNEELYDERSPRVASRKIFSKDDGEYVDFEEE